MGIMAEIKTSMEAEVEGAGMDAVAAGIQHSVESHNHSGYTQSGRILRMPRDDRTIYKEASKSSEYKRHPILRQQWLNPVFHRDRLNTGLIGHNFSLAILVQSPC